MPSTVPIIVLKYLVLLVVLVLEYKALFCDSVSKSIKISHQFADEPQHDIDSLISDGVGENIDWVSPPKLSQCRETVENWYSEADNYDYNTGKSKAGKSILHFTQVIWKGTTELGMATASNDNRRFIVARYKPRGNSGDPPNYIDNVPRPQ